ncbi:hypothetical protein BCR41DRAFT_104714 [Lobosporangium transversale]|uniref:Uncharacterized protein n=1 Tax=Lobosporangium transversale TaxID=64571 RepID=A0A1Y2GIV0_9FUNG|nr:hypothetical protein BCR41DRAFT_104714 [Lobosporangium transversale]ORZ12106.1 hypothetical protein BCR41DRAFT_104714 [Lobosporangium transversale]|eukprot:XP_021879971.1 hypothetical protein BCR41DRAFT_104714 [Lobosporangium transversale]
MWGTVKKGSDPIFFSSLIIPPFLKPLLWNEYFINLHKDSLYIQLLSSASIGNCTIMIDHEGVRQTPATPSQSYDLWKKTTSTSGSIFASIVAGNGRLTHFVFTVAVFAVFFYLAAYFLGQPPNFHTLRWQLGCQIVFCKTNLKRLIGRTLRLVALTI